MEALSTKDAEQHFGDLLRKAQRSPVAINKDGKAIAVLMSAAAYQQIERLKEQKLRAAIQEGIVDKDAGNISPGADVFGKLRKKI